MSTYWNFKIFGSLSYFLLVELKYGQEIFVTLQMFLNLTFVGPCILV